MQGTYRGYIADRKDPDKLGRVKLRVPALWDDQVHDYWAYPKGMFAGEGTGFIAMPEVGEVVWVEFENCNPRFPVWSYGHWVKEKAIADIYDSNGEPTKVALKTKSGQTLIIDDTEKTINLKQTDGSYLLLNKDYANLVGSKVSLGKEGGAKEPITLADTAADLLNDLISDLGNIGAITTNTGVTSTLSTSPGWAALVAKWKTGWEDMKSKITTSE